MKQVLACLMRVSPGIVLAMLAALVALGGASPAQAWVDCDVPNPPPICLIGEEVPEIPPPFGALDAVERLPAGLHVRGWAIDPETSASVVVRVTVDGRHAGEAPANLYRSDVAADHPAFGGHHGFDTVVSPVPGTRVCVNALRQSDGLAYQIACRTFAVRIDPYGSVDSIEQPSASLVRLRGWAIDPDTASPIDVHVYMDGVFVKAATADLAPGTEIMETGPPSPYPSPYGDKHRFDIALTAVKGTHTFCVYGINVGAGANSAVGCKVFTVGGVPAAPTLVRLGVRQLDVDSGYTAFVVVRDNANDETEYVVWKRADSGFAFVAASTSARAGVGSEFEVMLGGVSPGTSHCFYVTAANHWGDAPSGQSCFTVPPLPPLAPSNLVVTSKTDKTLSLSWRDNSSDEEGFTILSRNVTVAANSTGTTIAGLTPHATYCLSLVAFKNVAPFGRIESRPIAFPCVKMHGPPAAPTGLTMALSGSTLSLAWADASDNERGFHIQRGSEDGTLWQTVALVSSNSTSYSSFVGSLQPGTGYCYRVVAFNDYGSGASAPRCRGIALLSMYAYANKGFDFRTYAAHYRADARVDYVKNVSYTTYQKRQPFSQRVHDLDLLNVSHSAYVLGTLNRGQTTTAFNSRALNGEWTARATNVYGFDLHDRCTTTTTDDWYRSCSEHADVVLEVGWSN